MDKTKYLRPLLFFFAVILIAVATCCLTFFLLNKTGRGEGDDSHAWLHRELNLTGESDAKLALLETAFRKKEKRLKKDLAEANRELSAVLLEEKSYTPEVQKAVRKIHRLQGDLQNATIEHFFNMQAALEPEEKEKLLRIAAESLGESAD